MGPLGQPQRGVNAACGSVLGDAGKRAVRLRQRVRWATRVGAGPGREKAGLALERRKGGPRLELLG